MYSLISLDDKEVTKVKGVNKKIRHKEFVDVLFNKKVVRHNMKGIQSKLQRIGTCDVCKISLPCFDDKDINLMMMLIAWLIYIKI